ncbi:MAG: transcription elongation factor GreA [Bacteroidales bacterium]|nr:transcription elongation factor GreA [Bacteroidales bacterium]
MEYLSQECYDKLVAELNQMVNVELPRIIDAIAEAAAQGDRSENYEYHAAKRAQGKLLGQIRFKQNVLEHARVADMSNIDGSVVGLFRKVEITNLANNAKMTYTIVSPHEANLSEHKLSIQSPIAQALNGKKVGDIVEAQVPVGVVKLRIDSITV